MRCFACDKAVQDGYDKKTDRWYCFECFEPTNQILAKQLDDEMAELGGPPGAGYTVFTLENWVTERLDGDEYVQPEEEEYF